VHRFLSQHIQQALDSHAALPDYMGVNHGGLNVTMAEQFLYGPDVVTCFEKMGGEPVAEGVRADGLGQPGLAGGGPYGFLQGGFVDSHDDLVLLEIDILIWDKLGNLLFSNVLGVFFYRGTG
jgi:hypothetical protein